MRSSIVFTAAALIASTFAAPVPVGLGRVNITSFNNSTNATVAVNHASVNQTGTIDNHTLSVNSTRAVNATSKASNQTLAEQRESRIAQLIKDRDAAHGQQEAELKFDQHLRNEILIGVKKAKAQADAVKKFERELKQAEASSARRSFDLDSQSNTKRSLGSVLGDVAEGLGDLFGAASGGGSSGGGVGAIVGDIGSAVGSIFGGGGSQASAPVAVPAQSAPLSPFAFRAPRIGTTVIPSTGNPV